MLVTTDDGSAGTRGRVTAVLPELLTPGTWVYACGPMAMLRAVTEVSAAHGARAWCAVEESMACGVGVCMTCVLPVRWDDGVTRMTRTCVEGPTLDGAALRWDAIGAGPGGGSAVPADCLGAPRPGEDPDEHPLDVRLRDVRPRGVRSWHVGRPGSPWRTPS